MKIAPLPADEDERLAALLRYDVLDTDFEESYDELTQLATVIFGTPISLISLIDSDRQWFKSAVGLGARETPRDLAFCAHAIHQKEVFVVEDALEDERFHDNPLVAGDPKIRFYAGAPLVTTDENVLGTLCVIDRVPRQFAPEQQKALSTLAKQVMNQLELRLTYRRLQQYAHQMQETNAAKEKFLYMIAHDLRGPFNWMMGNSRLLVEELHSPELEECREMAQEIGEGCESSLRLLDNLLEWATCRSGRIEFRPSLIDLDELVSEVFTLLAGMVHSKSINLVRAGESSVKVQADRYMIYSVLQNLIHNAIKFTPEGGAVQVATAVVNSEVHLAVSDTGVGMSDEALQSIREIGDTVSTHGTEGEKGTGLGLLLCRQFVERHGGRLHVQSEPELGSTFRFALPLQPSPPATKSQGSLPTAVEHNDLSAPLPHSLNH